MHLDLVINYPFKNLVAAACLVGSEVAEMDLRMTLSVNDIG